ncbi:sugar transport protein 8-like [Mercurialis annua]|uniref:sugar transport protein 8-like n=1 Tax=Mercurialis annua TaxID=3986 RepID=UPI0024ACFA2E|nr:sugar transport protein 8-like [Mercurialis annua]
MSKEEIMEEIQVEETHIYVTEIEEIIEDNQVEIAMDESEIEDPYHVICKARWRCCFPMIMHAIALLGGVLVGYSTTIAGGVLDMDSYMVTFSSKLYKEEMHHLDNNCGFGSFQLQWYISSLYMAASISILFAFALKNIWGRRSTFRLGSTLMVLGTILTAVSSGFYVQSVGRIVTGVAIGLLLQVIPTIITEMEVDKTRGLNIKFGCFTAAGSTLAIGLNYFASYFHVWGWRLSTGFIIPVAFILFLISFNIFETPFWLVENRKISEAKIVLRLMMSATHVDDMCVEIEENISRRKVDNHLQAILHHGSRPALVIMVTTQILVQLLGFSVYTNYGPFMLQSLGYTSHEAFLFLLVCSILNTIIIFIQPWIFRIFGRRRPLIIASIFMLSSLAYASVIFFLYVDSHFFNGSAIVCVILGLTVTYIAAYSICFGPEAWLDVSFPLRTCAIGSVLEAVTSMFFSFLTNMFSTRLACTLGVHVFVYYSFCSLVMVLFILLLVPETRGVLMYSMARRVWSQHWLWKKYVSYHDIYV